MSSRFDSLSGVKASHWTLCAVDQSPPLAAPIASAAAIISPVLYGVPRTLALRQPRSEVFLAPVGIGLEATRREDHALGAELAATRVVVDLDSDHAAVLDDQPRRPRAVPDLGAELRRGAGVVGDQAFAPVDIAHVQPTPEQEAAVGPLVGLPLVHQPVPQAERVQPAHGVLRLGDQDLRQLGVGAALGDLLQVGEVLLGTVRAAPRCAAWRSSGSMKSTMSSSPAWLIRVAPAVK